MSDFYLYLISFLMRTKQYIIAVGTQHDLTAMQSMTLLVIDEHEPRPMNSLATLFGCDASNVTGIIDGLEQKGLIVRQESTKDRRIKVIKLTEAGARARHMILHEVATQENGVFTEFTPEEMREFTRLIKKLTLRCPAMPWAIDSEKRISRASDPEKLHA